jgi:hypothetical protein
MTHSHGHDTTVRDTTVIDRDGDSGARTTGMLLGIAAILLIAIIGLVVLFAEPWEDDGGGGVTDTAPGITDDSGGGGAGEGEGGGGGAGEGEGGGGEGGGGAGGDTGGGAEPGAGQ